MFCPLCGKPVPPGAAFCPSCGAAMRSNGPTPPGAGGPRPPAPVHRTGVQPPMARPTVGAPSVAADFDAQRKKQRWTMAGVGVAALIAAFFGLKAAGLLRLGASTPGPAVMARHDAPPPNLQLPAETTPPPILQPATAAAKVTMPDDVRDYLEHVRRCEEAKVKLESKQNAEAMVLLTKMQALGAGTAFLNNAGEIDPGSDENKDPQNYGKDKILDFRPDWDQLVAYFNSKQPPAECQGLASDFNTALGEIPGMMGDISSLLNDVTKDPAAALQKANGFKGKSYEGIDTNFGKADDEKNAICAKYDTKPWFDIKKDVGGGGMLSAFGNIGGGGLGGVSVPGG